MRKRCFIFLFTAALILICFSLVQSQENDKTTDVWLGTLAVGGAELRIIFKISESPEGILTATMDSPDQGATDIPVDKVTFKEGHLHIDMSSIGGFYKGDINEDGSEIDGQWTQAGTSFPLKLARTDRAPEMLRPQEPKPPYPYNEENVEYTNQEAGVKLAGTLTLPQSGQPFPVVLLITGSGAQDRNETVFGHKPFLVLADYLTRQGIAVLRVDDRGVGGSTGDISKATTEDFAGDVLAGVEYLKSRSDINHNQIGLIGHSEGGIIAPVVAVKSSNVAFIILMAGTGLPGDELLYLQAALIGKAEGNKKEDIISNHILQERMFAVVKSELDSATAEQKLREVVNDWLAELPEDQREAFDSNEVKLDVQIQSVLTSWFRHFLAFDPVPILKKVKCPVLAINGELDLQVPPRENLTAIEEALKAGGNEHYVIKELLGLNHLFQTAKTGSPGEYAKIEETISPTALETISEWIKKVIEEKN